MGIHTINIHCNFHDETKILPLYMQYESSYDKKMIQLISIKIEDDVNILLSLNQADQLIKDIQKILDDNRLNEIQKEVTDTDGSNEEIQLTLFDTEPASDIEVNTESPRSDQTS
jgi:hypothetical protein